MLPVNVALDNLVLMIKNVTLEEYDDFITKLQSNQVFYPDTIIRLGISSIASSYRYNLNFGQGQGSIRVDYKHNRHPENVRVCDMRLEFNPSKLEFLNHQFLSKNNKGENIFKECFPAQHFFKIMNTHFNNFKGDRRITELTGEWSGHVRIIREMDIAFDFNTDMANVVVMNKSGKEKSLYKGTHYWGAKHSHGYLKMYDKLKERIGAYKKIERMIKNNQINGEYEKEKINKIYRKFLKYDNLTRLEYTMRFDDGVGLPELDRIKDYNINNQYDIRILDYNVMGKFEPTIKAYLLCYINGLMEEKEMSRRYREKMKKALQELNQINLDKILTKQFNGKIINEIKKYIRLN